MSYINKQNTLDAIIQKAKEELVDVNHYFREGVQLAVDVVEGMPEVPPERKRGKWKIIMARHKYNGEYREVRQCSECHAAYFHYANQEDIEDEIPNFCPNCGADMRGEQDDSISN